MSGVLPGLRPVAQGSEALGVPGHRPVGGPRPRDTRSNCLSLSLSTGRNLSGHLSRGPPLPLAPCPPSRPHAFQKPLHVLAQPQPVSVASSQEPECPILPSLRRRCPQRRGVCEPEIQVSSLDSQTQAVKLQMGDHWVSGCGGGQPARNRARKGTPAGSGSPPVLSHWASRPPCAPWRVWVLQLCSHMLSTKGASGAWDGG